jgi:protein involved in polysaccharide export with SLBB domain
MKTWIVSLSSTCILALVGIGCQSTGPRFEAREHTEQQLQQLTNLTSVTSSIQPNPELLDPATNFYTLGPGDSLEIELLGKPESEETVLVGPGGKIYYYILPGLNVWGKTLGETKERIEQELSRYIQNGPRVTVTLRAVQSKQIWILGQVTQPGIYPLTTPMTLLEAVSLAGGPTAGSQTASAAPAQTNAAVTSTGANHSPPTGVPSADLKRAFVMREGKLLPVDLHRLLERGDMTQNIQLRAGDFIYFPPARTQEIYVLGKVRQPQVIRYDKSLTLVGAIARAGGLLDDAHRSQLAIVRGSLAEPQVALVDYQDIANGKQPNVLLESGDIVYAPKHPFQTLKRYADMVLNTFVRTIGINEGSRAVSRDARPVGVNVPVNSQ